LDVRRYGIRADDASASAFLEADVYLFDADGIELWRRSVHAWDRLTPRVHADLGGVVTAATLHYVTVEDLERAVDGMVDAAASRVGRDLRDDLRDTRS
jgi:hypothetical protein